MSPQTVTHAIESDSEPAKMFQLLSEVENIPRWAPVFADKIERISDSRCRVTKDGEAFEIEVFSNPVAGTVDYIREMSEGKRGGAYIRAIPRPLGGTSITMTVPIAANTAPAEVAKVLEAELAALVRLA